MKTAQELYEFTMEQKSQIVDKVLRGVKEHIIECLDRESKKGATYYSIYLNETHSFVKDLLLKECIKLSHEFEENGYKVSIDDSGNGYYVNFILTVSWDGKVKARETGDRHLYDTDIYETEKRLCAKRQVQIQY